MELVVFEFEQFVYCISGEYGEYCISGELFDSNGEWEDINGDDSIEFCDTGTFDTNGLCD